MKEYIVSTETAYEFEMRRFEELQELIRCKDCKYYTGKWCTTKQFDINDICKGDNDFCSQAEERGRGMKFEAGEYFIYVSGDINGTYELGKVKRPNNKGDGYFCWYHEGDTCANTPVEFMHKLVNRYVIREDGFGKAE